MSSMKIIFHPQDEQAEALTPPPESASRHIPEWYMRMTKYLRNSPEKPTLWGDGSHNLTLKACPPFLDAMITGYMVTLPCDIQVRRNGPQKFELTWASGDLGIIDTHIVEQTEGYPNESGGQLAAFKWVSSWGIETPRGYSVLVTHPQNRFDLPFRTFSGVVDTDDYNVPINFPFEILDHMVEGNSIVIEAGTPIAQIIPFKREKWQSKVAKLDEARIRKNFFDLRKTIFKSYKLNYWKKKTYM